MLKTRKWFFLIKDERGGVTGAELALIVGVAALIAFAVVSALLPAFRDLHTRAQNSVTGISETGF